MNALAYTVVGTWEMVEAWDIGDNEPGQKTYPWGNPSAGYWVFDKSGHFSLMISQNPPLAIPADPFSGKPQPGWLNPTPPWKVPDELFVETFVTAAPYAYFGTYEVQMTQGTESGNLLLTVFSDVMRVYTGTIQTRPFTFDGYDYINVGDFTDPTKDGSYLRRLRRLSS